MLLDRASALTEKINAYQKLKSTGDEVKQVTTRARQFEEVSRLINGLRNTLKILSDADVRVEFKMNNSVSFAEKAHLLREEIKTDFAKLNDPPFDIRYEFNDRLKEMAIAGENAAREAWSGYVEGRAQFGEDDVLSALSQVPQFRESVLKIQKIRGEIAALGQILPPDPKRSIKILDNLVDEHENAWNMLDAADIPKSVLMFIRAAANGAAKLTTFTPDVQSWLERRDLLDAFRIKLR